ncbi:hypothetical protein GBAR_LOCUS4176 [Geodia barretti]|uniref:Uncharacterized protein n=1 Tax=Geodia barretti TaxID=519541 RepID=A0AA35W839_GEOBA|nr:hypothetical protein GBAR_LOCUS4176 [Geodia barretti]
MTTTSVQDRVDELFADARDIHAQAVQRLEHGDIRDAAEKAWCATKRATDALILALTGDEPVTTARTTDDLDDLTDQEPVARTLQGRYYSRLGQLHGACFYDGRCNRHTERRIRETAAYIDDAEALAIR